MVGREDWSAAYSLFDAYMHAPVLVRATYTELQVSKCILPI